jgi:hypothetical protein
MSEVGVAAEPQLCTSFDHVFTCSLKAIELFRVSELHGMACMNVKWRSRSCDRVCCRAGRLSSGACACCAVSLTLALAESLSRHADAAGCPRLHGHAAAEDPDGHPRHMHSSRSTCLCGSACLRSRKAEEHAQHGLLP